MHTSPTDVNYLSADDINHIEAVTLFKQLDPHVAALMMDVMSFDYYYHYSDDGAVWRTWEDKRVDIVKRAELLNGDIPATFKEDVKLAMSKLSTVAFLGTYPELTLLGHRSHAVKAYNAGVSSENYASLLAMHEELQAIVAEISEHQGKLRFDALYIYTPGTSLIDMRGIGKHEKDHSYYGISLPLELQARVSRLFQGGESINLARQLVNISNLIKVKNVLNVVLDENHDDATIVSNRTVLEYHTGFMNTTYKFQLTVESSRKFGKPEVVREQLLALANS